MSTKTYIVPELVIDAKEEKALIQDKTAAFKNDLKIFKTLVHEYQICISYSLKSMQCL